MRNNYLFLPLSYCENLFAKGINSLTIEIGRLLFEEYVLEYVWNQFFFWIETFSNTNSKMWTHFCKCEDMLQAHIFENITY